MLKFLTIGMLLSLGCAHASGKPLIQDEDRPVCTMVEIRKGLDIIRCSFPTDNTVCYVTMENFKVNNTQCLRLVEAEIRT
jgi:hypothetical protein